MAHHHVTSADIAINGDHLDASKVSKVKSLCLGTAVIGVIFSILVFTGVLGEHLRGTYAYSWLFAFYFYLTLSIGGVFWTLLHNVSNSSWGTSVRRTFENIGITFPWMMLFAIPLLFPQIQHYLYEWMNVHSAAKGNVKEWLKGHDYELFRKYWYMNKTFWYLRVIGLYGIVFSAIIIGLRKLSTDQDTDPNPGTWRLLKARKHSTYTLIIFAITITFTGYDFLLGLDYTWSSTMWGVYLFAGSALNSLAVAIIVCTWLKSTGHLKHVTSPEHFHVMGKLLFTFTVFWAYITFSQFFLIWYANITEETSYYLIRNTGNWNIGMIVLLFLHFVVPFVILLQSWLKKNPKLLSAVAVYTLCMHVLDHYLIVIPERGISLGNIDHKVFGDIQVSIPGAFWGDIAAFVTIGAAFTFILLRAIGQHSVYPNRDPRILESANITS
jgi:hypothetical protein